jgi:ammonium transporter Rh
LNATLAGGVAIGAPAGITTNPAASLLIGITAGIVSTVGFRFLTAKLEDTIGLYDTCGINNLHGIPGILGGIFSAIIIAAYNIVPITDPATLN